VRNTVAKSWGLAQDLIYFIRRRDFHAAGQWMLETLVNALYCRIDYTVFVRFLEEPLPSFEPRLSITYCVAEPSHLSRLRGVVLPSRLKYLSTRLAHGRICIMAYCEDDIAAYAWATDVVSFEIDNLELRLEAGDIYIDDLYTLPACRHQGIQTALHAQQLQYLQERGYERAVSIVAVDNIPSQKIFRRFGYRKADSLSFRRILLKRHYHYHNGRF
jgi:ribosomal protein S18 acetylase RimI-like enzyme